MYCFICTSLQASRTTFAVVGDGFRVLWEGSVRNVCRLHPASVDVSAQRKLRIQVRFEHTGVDAEPATADERMPRGYILNPMLHTDDHADEPSTCSKARPSKLPPHLVHAEPEPESRTAGL